MLKSTAVPHVLSIPPYPPGRSTSAVAREFGLNPESIIKLASNENPMGASPLVRAAVAQASEPLALYPDFDCVALGRALSETLGVPSDHVLAGAGSSDLILLAARGFLDSGRTAVMPQYSFASYEGSVRSVGARAVIVPVRGWAPDLDALRDAVDEQTGVLFLATPNNPTGALVSPGDLERLLVEIPPHVLIVLDEAYREYLELKDQPDLHRLMSLRENLLVLRTFSKIHGLAGLRVGYGIAQPAIISILKRLQLPFSVNAVAQAAAVAALGDAEFASTGRQLNAAERQRLGARLADEGFDHPPSYGNFLLVHVGDGPGTFQALMRRGVVVRPVANYGLPEWIRVTIGLPAQNDIFLDRLRELKPGGSRVERAVEVAS